MTVRIFRAWMKPEDEGRIYSDFRTGLAQRFRPAGYDWPELLAMFEGAATTRLSQAHTA